MNRGFGDDLAEAGFTDILQAAPEQDFARANGVSGRLISMDEARDLPGECCVRVALLRALVVFASEVVDFLGREKSEVFQEADDVAVIGLDEVLIKAIHARFVPVEPDSAFDAL